MENEGLQSRNAPHELSGVKTFDPKKDTPLEIIKSYHEKDIVKCSCGVNKPHKQGIVVRFDNGNNGLMGLNCARRDFGDEAVNNLESHFAAKKRTHINKALIAPTLKRIEEDRTFLAQEKDNAEKKDSFFSALQALAGDIYAKLENAAQKEYGRWTKEVIVSRTAVDRSGKEKTIIEAQKNTLFVIDGYKAISTNTAASIASVAVILGRAEHFIRLEPYQDKNIETARKYLRDAEQKLAEIKEQLEAAKSFFTPQNLRAISQAVEKDDDLNTELIITKRKLRVPSHHWENKFEYIDIPYFLAGLSDDGTKAVA